MALVAETRAACGGPSVPFREAYPQWLPSSPPANTRRRFFFSARSPRTLTAGRSAALDEGSSRESVTATTPPRTLASHPGPRRWGPGRAAFPGGRSVVVVVLWSSCPDFTCSTEHVLEKGLCLAARRRAPAELPDGSDARKQPVAALCVEHVDVGGVTDANTARTHDGCSEPVRMMRGH